MGLGSNKVRPRRLPLGSESQGSACLVALEPRHLPSSHLSHRGLRPFDPLRTSRRRSRWWGPWQRATLLHHELPRISSTDASINQPFNTLGNRSLISADPPGRIRPFFGCSTCSVNSLVLPTRAGNDHDRPIRLQTQRQRGRPHLPFADVEASYPETSIGLLPA